MVDRIADPWGPRTPYRPGEEWPVRVDCFLSDGHTEADVQRWVPSASILHSNGDAMDIAVVDDRIVGVRGRAGDRINHGRVDPKDLYGWQANHSPDRLRRPLVREGDRLVETDWDTAMGRIVARSKQLLDGPGGWGHFGFYTSGQLFLEEYYTLAVIGKAGLGTPHMDGNTRLCTATAAAALKASFGTDGQPGSYTDVDHCDAIALWGHNVAEGFYQSNQATAAACQVNNLHLIRGMIGRPGAGLYQMNGQPTAQNNRECGADGDLPGLRNWENEAHVAELARLWNVEVDTIPHWAPPTHAMQIFRYAEQGSIKLLWISATNPAVSLPDLARVRRILTKPELFLVVQDLFLTETAELADVVLPAATWGEKTGTFTSVDRTVHISDKAVDPPGEARPDLDIFLDYARRMDFRNSDGDPLITWTDPESAFEAWKECSRGRPCDYTGITYERLRAGGIQWPCNEEHPDGTERLYPDGVFHTDPDYCETYGQDLVTGAELLPEEYRAKEPRGRAFLHAAPYLPSPEVPGDEYPLLLTTGRTVYQFHTRTKTGRAPQLVHAAPEVWVELNPTDAERLGVAEGDLVRVESPRGVVRARARVCGIRPGVVFLPFHYGYWDVENAEPARAANELTITAWDPVSKQPIFKVAAVRVVREADSGGRPAPAPTVGGSEPPPEAGVPATVGGRPPRRRPGWAPPRSRSARPPPGSARPRPARRGSEMHLAHYLGLLHKAQVRLGKAYGEVGTAHRDEPDVFHMCQRLAAQCAEHARKLDPFARRYAEEAPEEPDRLHSELFRGTRTGGIGLLRDLQDLYLMAAECDICWTVVGQAAYGARDEELLAVVRACEQETARQLTWLRTRMKQAAPQALVVAE